MSWMQKLYQTYNAALAHNLKNTDAPLTPVGHTLQTAHIVVVIDGTGNFQTARVMAPKTVVMLPVTESSESRSGTKPPPHPLADKIQYVAKDYANYGGSKDSFFDGYFNQLQKWCESSFMHPKVLAISRYVGKGRVMADLVQAGIFQLDSDGHILNKWIEDGDAPPIFSVLPKTKGEIEPGAALVCWQVEIAGDVESETWEDKSIQEAWTAYVASSDAAEKGFCVVQGKEAVVSTLHPAKLRHTGDKAKLISANDKSGYTFRGRFEAAEEAASVSSEVSAKAHSALRWLIARQGIRNGDQVSVAWAINGATVPAPLQDSYHYLDDEDDTDNAAPSLANERPSETANTLDWSINIGRKAAQIIKKKMHGFKAELNAHEQISLLMLDSATPGRMALTYYQEFLPADYFDNLNAWVDDFAWYQRYTRETQEGKKTAKQTVWPWMPPSPLAIAQTVYGRSLSDTLKKQVYARLLSVIAGGKNVPIPFDWVQQSFQVACSPSGYERWEWERNVGVACALYKGWRARHHDLSQRRTFTMSLETENTSRDYLFGRLFAVLEKIESKALQVAGETRSTNAERYLQRFAMRPLTTWLQIANGLEPYKDRLRNNRYMGFLRNREKELDEIGVALNEYRKAGIAMDDPLNGEFLLGYHSQKMAYRHQWNAANDANEDEHIDNETV